MNRQQLLHVIEEIGRRFDLDYFYIVGAAAALAQIDKPPADLQMTRDVDVIPNLSTESERQAARNQIDFVIGEGSDFDLEFGYYAQGVGFDTPQFAPTGWNNRCRPVRSAGYTALCMDLIDLVIAKLGAGREKDLSFARSIADMKVLDGAILTDRITVVESTVQREIIADRVGTIFSSS